MTAVALGELINLLPSVPELSFISGRVKGISGSKTIRHVDAMMSQSTIFQSCQDRANGSWVFNSPLGELNCICRAQGHKHGVLNGDRAQDLLIWSPILYQYATMLQKSLSKKKDSVFHCAKIECTKFTCVYRLRGSGYK